MGHLLKLKFAHSPLKRDSVKRFFASGFLHESSSPKPLKMTKGHFKFFFKLALLVSTTAAANFATGNAGVVDTGGN
jgi:hypothetical protein